MYSLNTRFLFYYCLTLYFNALRMSLKTVNQLVCVELRVWTGRLASETTGLEEARRE
jgi:hypothetical protein